MRSHQLLPPGAVARKNRCDSKALLGQYHPQENQELALLMGVRVGSHLGARTALVLELSSRKLGMPSTVLRPPAQVPGREYGRDLLQRPRLHHKYEMGMGPGAPACHCTNPQTQIGEVTGRREVSTLSLVKCD